MGRDQSTSRNKERRSKGYTILRKLPTQIQKRATYQKVYRSFWVTSGARTHDTRNHNPMLCQLSYSHRVAFLSKACAKVLLFFDMTKYFQKKSRKSRKNSHFSCVYAKFVVPLHRFSTIVSGDQHRARIFTA